MDLMMGTAAENPLLASVPAAVADAYYAALVSGTGQDVQVRLDAGGNRGKGLFATKEFRCGDTILVERPLAAVQHVESKAEVPSCCYCFRAVGRVEQHLGAKLCCLINQLSEAAVDPDEDLKALHDRMNKINASVTSSCLEGLLKGTQQLSLTDPLDMPAAVKCRGGCGDEYCSTTCESEAWTCYHCLLCPVGQVEDAQADTASSSCSSSAAVNKGKDPATKQQRMQYDCKHRSSPYTGAGRSGACSSSRGTQTRAHIVHQVHAVTVSRTKLAKFLEHADESNDIFRIAAQVIASTLIQADKLLQQRQQHQQAQPVMGVTGFCYSRAAVAARTVAQAAGLLPGHSQFVGRDVVQVSSVPARQQAAIPAAGHPSTPPQEPQQQAVGSAPEQQQRQQQPPYSDVLLAALQTAFLPFAVGRKAPWWDMVAQQQTSSSNNSGDGSSSSNSEGITAAELQAQMRELSAESLGLLQDALQDARFPQLFDLQLYGSLVGLCELNNLGLTVPAPVARYKAMLLNPQQSCVDPAAATAALDEVGPLLEALGDDADTPAQGTGFYALHSTVNHSCSPNATANCLPTGELVITAAQDLQAGDEVLLSYIEEEGADLQERRAMLRDYGFLCSCTRCAAEELASSLQQQQSRCE